jgi:hypothetical protein
MWWPSRPASPFANNNCTQKKVDPKTIQDIQFVVKSLTVPRVNAYRPVTILISFTSEYLVLFSNLHVPCSATVAVSIIMHFKLDSERRIIRPWPGPDEVSTKLRTNCNGKLIGRSNCSLWSGDRWMRNRSDRDKAKYTRSSGTLSVTNGLEWSSVLLSAKPMCVTVNYGTVCLKVFRTSPID